jgi:hypothetical protein
MLEKRIISNITALVKETGVSRRALNLILEDQIPKGYLLDSAIGEGSCDLDVLHID